MNPTFISFILSITGIAFFSFLNVLFILFDSALRGFLDLVQLTFISIQKFLIQVSCCNFVNFQFCYLFYLFLNFSMSSAASMSLIIFIIPFQNPLEFKFIYHYFCFLFLFLGLFSHEFQSQNFLFQEFKAAQSIFNSLQLYWHILWKHPLSQISFAHFHFEVLNIISSIYFFQIHS